MPSIGPLSAGVGASAAGSPSWSNAFGGVTASDGSEASQGSSTNGDWPALLSTDFGFSIPSGATIDGVLIEAELKDDSSQLTFTNAWLLHGGSQIGTTDTTDNLLSGTLTYYSRGGASSLWGATLSDTIVNASTFGVAIQMNKASGGSSRQADCDHVRITVYYTESATPVALDGTSTGTATATASLTVLGATELTGTASGLASVTGSLAVARALIGTAAGVATATADLTVPGRATSITVASVRRSQPRFYLSIYPAIGATNSRERLDQIDINPSVTGLNWQSSVPGGFAQMTVGIDHNDSRRDAPLADPLIPRNLMLADYCHAELTDGGLTLWEGRIEDRDEPPGGTRQLVAHGYGYTALHDMPYLGDSTTLATSGTVLKAVIASAASIIRPASGAGFSDPQVPHAPVDFQYLYSSQVLDQIVKEGDSSGHLMDWAVWESRRLELKPRIPPAVPDYWVPFERKYVTGWTRHIADRIGLVVVTHTVNGVPTVTGPIVDERFSEEVGFQRGVPLHAGEMSVSAATRLAKTKLGHLGPARYTGEVNIGPDDTLIGYGGQPVPPYLARAGQWVQVGDYHRVNNPPLIAVVSECNANAGRLRLQIGDRAGGYDAQVARIMRDVKLQQAGTNPVGGRVRA